jgi:hypothetical protein
LVDFEVHTNHGPKSPSGIPVLLVPTLNIIISIIPSLLTAREASLVLSLAELSYCHEDVFRWFAGYAETATSASNSM